MKKLFSSSALLIAGAVMISTLSNAQSISITKRHYTKGYYVDFGKSKKVVTKAANEQNVKQNIAPINSGSINSIPVVSNNAPDQMNMVAVNNISVKREKTKKHNAVINVVAKSAKTLLNNSSNVLDVIASPNVNNNVKTGGGGGTIPVILLIIIALVCAPLAVYLHDNQIAPHFWWVLILWLLGIGFGLGIDSLAYLLWLAAVIWAILIVMGSAGNV